MRLAIIVATVGVLAAPTLAQEGATSSQDAPPVQGPSSQRETLPGAASRANHKLEWFYRGIELREQNQGLNGRKNSTNDAAQRAETPRGAQQDGDSFSEWQRW